jgi:hypothetical protein
MLRINEILNLLGTEIQHQLFSLRKKVAEVRMRGSSANNIRQFTPSP